MAVNLNGAFRFTVMIPNTAYSQAQPMTKGELELQLLELLQSKPSGIGFMEIDRRLILKFSPSEVSGKLGACFTELAERGLIERTDRRYCITKEGVQHLNEGI